jgi:SAM-dependent methyltransferase
MYVKMTSAQERPPSLEELIESVDLKLEVLHPGGLAITKELAEFCHVSKDTKLLDVSSGTGESACFLAEQFGCQVTGVDVSDYMVDRARRKAAERGLSVAFKQGDAHNLPFDEHSFDAVISECTTCLLEKERAISEMVRVAKPGRYVGIHDICWKEDTPEQMKQKLAEIEGERPETLAGWKRLFEQAGLKDVVTVDKSSLIPDWEKSIRKELGLVGELKIFLKVLTKWGISGFKHVRASEQIFKSPHVGYGIIVGRKS